MTISTGNSYLDSLTTASKASAATATKNSKKALDQTDFLKLLTTQMTTQDPTAPMDNSQMVAQMAQFSSTTGIAEMNASLKSLVAASTSRVGDAASWIGKSALVASSSATALADGGYAGNVNIAKDASQVNISLVDSTGKVVYNGNATNVAAGDVPFYWDGKDSDGKAVSGPLTVSVNAKDTAAQQLATTISTWTTISGVQSPASGTTKLVTPLGVIAPEDALQLS